MINVFIAPQSDVGTSAMMGAVEPVFFDQNPPTMDESGHRCGTRASFVRKHFHFHVLHRRIRDLEDGSQEVWYECEICKSSLATAAALTGER